MSRVATHVYQSGHLKVVTGNEKKGKTLPNVLLSGMLVCVIAPFSSDRQHLSYDGCLEVRGEIIRTGNIEA